jgi:beta-glucanase (GH16 family)
LEVDKDAECACFLVNDSTTTYYTQHLFLDFRQLSQYAGVPDVITDAADAADAPYSSEYFEKNNWTDIWDIQTWDNSYGPDEGLSNDAGVLMVNSRSNVYIEENKDRDAGSDTYLTLRTKRVPDFQTAAEFQSTPGNFQFVSMRMLARTIGSAGAVTGMFTYRDETGKLADIQESDIEMLTRGPRNKIQYTNQPSYTEDGGHIPEATRNSTTPDWTNWVEHRLDWTPEVVVWYVDKKEVSRIQFQTPKKASDLHFSAWSDGGTWSGNMSMDHEALQQIQWIEILYNTTDEGILKRHATLEKREEDGCKVVCSIDDSDETGKVVVLWDSAAVGRMFNDKIWRIFWVASAIVYSILQ